MSGAPVGRFEWEQALRETPGISMPLRGVLSLMATHADYDTGENSRPSLTKMAQRLEVQRSTLTRHVGEGVRLDWLGCTEDNRLHGKPSVYRLTRPAGGDANMQHPLTLSRTGGDANMQQGVPQICRTTYTDTSTTTYTDTSTEPTGAAAWAWVEANEAAKAAALAEKMAEAPPF